jgi:amino acid adenylation domain-containing protein
VARTVVVPRGMFVEFPVEEIEQSISDRFEQQVERFPDRIAVKTGAAELTYAELDDWANRIASAILARRGEKPEPVGLLLEQGVSSIAAILGVLKAGKIYVPLDPTYPQARLAKMLDWAGAGLLATDSLNTGLAASLIRDDGNLLVVDRLGNPGDGERPDLRVSPDAVAYIFFTSGSTGEPKGVFDSHRNVLHNIRRYTNALTIGPEDRLTLLQSCAFSGSVSSLFCALLNGAAVFPFKVGEEGAGRLAELLVQQRLTMYHSVPAIFRSFLIGGARFPEIRIVRLEGDRASSLDVELYRRHFDPACVLANGLGTTETGLCRQFLIDANTQVGDGILPVGYPVTDMDVMLLDDDDGQVEAGKRGEIAVRSRYLALGYWRRPDLTNAAFQPDPDGGPERIYRTGDLGRLHGDGCLDYLARKDFQPKVRGHRVDTADVESALIAVEGVRDAVVATRENARAEPELVAYVVPAGATPLDAGALRTALADALPRHLIPTRFLQLDALPLDNAGKVDRRGLPPPEEIARERAGRGPHDSLEQQLVGIWQEVLELGPIGVDESILDLGGDSLAAAVIVARVENETGWRLTPAQLFEHSTVASLADALRTDHRGTISPLRAINPHGSLPPLFLVHDLMGEVARYADIARHLGDDQPVWGLECTTDSDSIELMAARYLTEIRRIQPSGPYRLGGWCFGGVVAFEMAHQLRANGEEVAFLALIGISAWDFPQLVAPSAWRRYQLSNGRGLQARARFHLSAARAMSTREGTNYLVRKIIRLAPRLQTGTSQRLASLLRRPRHPDSRSGLSRRRQAFARYIALPYPGRVVLILAAEETAGYSSDPASDWRRLGTAGVDIIELPGNHDEILAEPHAQELADRLRELLLATGGDLDAASYS